MSFDDYDTHEEKKNMYMIRKLFQETFLDGSFQRWGGVDRASGWSINSSNEYIKSLMGNAVFNKIIVADVECNLLYAKRRGDAASEGYYQCRWDAGHKYVSIDGNNSSSTIAAFLDGHEKIHYIDPAGNKKMFADLTPDEQDDVMYTEKLDVAILRQLPIEEMCNLFRRLNMSTKLNAQEKRQARLTGLSKFIRDASNLPEVRTMFTNFVFQEHQLDKRSHEETVAQFALKLTGRSSVHNPELDKFYKAIHRLTPVQEKEITKNLKIVAMMATEVGALANNKGTRLKRGQLLVLQDVIHEITIKRGYKILEPAKIFKWFAVRDHAYRMASKTVTAEDALEKSYQYWIDHPFVRPSWTKSLAKMMEAFEEIKDDWVADKWIVKKRTSAAAFTQDQKEELLYLQEGQTRKGEQIDLFDLYGGSLEADHVISVKEGGTTEIPNGELMFTEDNRRKGAESADPYFDFQKDN